MNKPLIATIAAAGVLVAAASPAMAGDHKRQADHLRQPNDWVYSDMNSHFLDYKTDISEAKRELVKDLRRANDEGDRIDAYDEYDREVADAQHDFRKEMVERGYLVPKGSVQVTEVSWVPRTGYHGR